MPISQIVTNSIADSAVVTADIANGAVTTAKLAATTGSGNVVLSTSPTLVTPALGTPSAINLTNATALPKGALPVGSILQVVQTMTNGDQSFAPTGNNPPNASWISVSGFNVSITPTYATSKILVSCAFKCCGNTNGNSPGNPYWGGRITFSTGGGYSVVPPVGAAKSGSAQAHFNISPDRADGSQYRMTSCNTIQLLHSPNTTSSINYRLEIAGFLEYLIFGSPNINGGDDDYWTEPYGITVMEVAA